jgi:hypothetical protein
MPSRIATTRLRAGLTCIVTGLVLSWAGRAWTANGQDEPDAGRWKTWAIPSGNAVEIPAPPDATATALEIRELKTQLAHDAAGLERIAYWDRGWPGYRWQEIALAESQKDPKPFILRTMALVSVAINDATVAAWHAKYKYSRARPSDVDPTIEPAAAVPRSPSYPSEHAVVAAATSDVLRLASNIPAISKPAWSLGIRSAPPSLHMPRRIDQTFRGMARSIRGQIFGAARIRRE